MAKTRMVAVKRFRDSDMVAEPTWLVDELIVRGEERRLKDSGSLAYITR